MKASYPTLCIVEKPTSQSVMFGGAFINLHTLSKTTGYSVSLLSLTISGKRSISLRAAVSISNALGMTLDSFASALGYMIHPTTSVELPSISA